MSTQRPQLKPALRRVWRDGSTLQLGVDPAHAVLISGLDPAAVRMLDCLDGTRDLRGLSLGAAAVGIEPERLDELLRLLTRAGVLQDCAADDAVLAGLGRGEQERLGPDIAAASLLQRGRAAGGDPVTHGADLMSRRRRAVVQVFGAGRVGASVTTLLAAAGVGALVVEDAGVTRPGDVAPAASSPDDVGVRRQDAALRAARRVAPSVRASLPTGRERPDLAVLCSGAGGDTAGLGGVGTADRLLRGGVPHLIAHVRETTGIVGPLVLPGRSSCQRCHDLHRADRDPAWPRVAAQLTGSSRIGPVPCDAVLATAVAAHAALQVLAFLDGDLPPAVDGTLEIAQIDGRVRRRSWSAHPSCGCGWGNVDLETEDLPAQMQPPTATRAEPPRRDPS